MELADIDRLAASLDGVVARTSAGLRHWRYQGRLVARQLDEMRIVVRAEFDVRDALLTQFPDTFSVPRRYAKHMMVVADLRDGDPDAIEDAIAAAWKLQSES
ncbi:MAG: hypothetical protein ACRDO7_06000 [Nocardioidaceae bacterium]